MANDERRAGTHEKGALGPLVVSGSNPRYFTAATGGAAGQRAVYLTGLPHLE